MKKISNFKEFTDQFHDNDACYKLLYDMRWSKGFKCKKCPCTTAIKGKRWFYKRCQSCGYNESCIANTMFHKLKFPIVRAFWIIYQLSTLKKGMSTHEIARQYGIHQTTAWYFKVKIHRAMGMDFETFMSEEMAKANASKDAHEDASKDDPTSNPTTSTNEETQQHDHVPHPGESNLDAGNTTHPASKSRRASTQTIEQIGTNENENVTQTMDSAKLNSTETFLLKHWLTGTHHRVSEHHLDGYIDEFESKARHKIRPSNLFKIVVNGFLKHSHLPYRSVVGK